MPLYSNYFQLEAAPNWMLYQYHVSFSPEVENKKFRMFLVKQHREMLGETRAFDGMVLFLARRLPQDVSILFTNDISQCERTSMLLIRDI